MYFYCYTLISLKKIFIFTLYLVLCAACNRVRHKEKAIVEEAKQAARSTKHAIVDKKDAVLDKLDPGYDSDEPDTKANKKRFKERLRVDVTPDVTNIYAYGDFFAIDYKVLMSFSCNQATADKIIAAHKMKLSQEFDDGLGFSDNFNWWNKGKIAVIKPYKFGKELAYWEYFWYDKKTGQAWYEEYSM